MSINGKIICIWQYSIVSTDKLPLFRRSALVTYALQKDTKALEIIEEYIMEAALCFVFNLFLDSSVATVFRGPQNIKANVNSLER